MQSTPVFLDWVGFGQSAFIEDSYLHDVVKLLHSRMRTACGLSKRLAFRSRAEQAVALAVLAACVVRTPCLLSSSTMVSTVSLPVRMSKRGLSADDRCGCSRLCDISRLISTEIIMCFIVSPKILQVRFSKGFYTKPLSLTKAYYTTLPGRSLQVVI